MNERDIFLNALEKPDEQARARYLDEICGGDGELRARIEKLIAANSKAAEFLEHSPPGLALTILTDASHSASHSLQSSSLDFLTPSEKPGCMGTLGVYEVVGVVGRGAFGIVLRAYDTKLNRIVAIKVMSPELSTNPNAVKRFLREAQAAAAVRHDHVVTIHAIEESNEPPFIVMEFVEGESLQEKIDREGSLPLNEILRIGKQMAAGLAAAHDEGLVHRDIKPANILLENGIQRVQITDFGLARAVDDVGMTQTGIIAGTPQYMSPEQGLGKPIDARSDLFSMGSVLYTLCTGRAPFRADSAVATLRRVCDDIPRSIREVNPDIPEWLERIIFQLLCKDAAHRIQSAREVADVLGACLSHLQSDEKSPTPDAARAISHAYKFEESQVSKQAGIPRHAMQFFWMLIGHLAAVLFTCVAFMIDVRSIMYLAPLLSMAAVPVAVWAMRKRLGWFCVGYGIYWPLMLIAFYWAYAASMPESSLAEVALPCTAVIGILWGVSLLAKQFFDLIRQPAFELSSLMPSVNLYLRLMFLQCLGLACAAANSMIEPAAAVPWAAILLTIGAVLSWVCLATSRDKLSLAFAVSTVVLSATTLAMGWMLPLDDYLFDARANWTVRSSLMIIFSVVLLGLSNLYRELIRNGKINGLTKRFSTKSVLVVVAMLAVVLAAARPFLEFSGQAFVAGFLMFLTVLALTYLLILSIGGMRLRWKLSITLICIAVLAGVSRLAHMYDLHTRQTHLWVETKETVDLRIIQSNAHFPRNLTAHPGDAGWSFHSGSFEIEIVGRNDLKAVPSKLDPPPRVWTKVKIVPVNPSD